MEEKRGKVECSIYPAISRRSGGNGAAWCQEQERILQRNTTKQNTAYYVSQRRAAKGKPQHLGCWRRALNCTPLHLFWFPIIPVKELTRKEKPERCHEDFPFSIPENPPRNELD